MVEARKDRRYTNSHEWALKEGSLIVVGITDHAVQELSDLVFIDLPETGKDATAGEPFGEVESVKAVSELNSPVAGTIVEVNNEIEDNLDIIVESPYDDGWLIKIDPSEPGDYEALLTSEQYLEHVEKE